MLCKGVSDPLKELQFQFAYGRSSNPCLDDRLPPAVRAALGNPKLLTAPLPVFPGHEMGIDSSKLGNWLSDNGFTIADWNQAVRRSRETPGILEQINHFIGPLIPGLVLAAVAPPAIVAVASAFKEIPTVLEEPEQVGQEVAVGFLENLVGQGVDLLGEGVGAAADFLGLGDLVEPGLEGIGGLIGGALGGEPGGIVGAITGGIVAEGEDWLAGKALDALGWPDPKSAGRVIPRPGPQAGPGGDQGPPLPPGWTGGSMENTLADVAGGARTGSGRVRIGQPYVGPDGKIHVRHRRMNPLNIHAARRSIRRLHSLERLTRSVVHFIAPKKARGKAVFKLRRKSKR